MANSSDDANIASLSDVNGKTKQDMKDESQQKQFITVAEKIAKGLTDDSYVNISYGESETLRNDKSSQDKSQQNAEEINADDFEFASIDQSSGQISQSQVSKISQSQSARHLAHRSGMSANTDIGRLSMAKSTSSMGVVSIAVQSVSSNDSAFDTGPRHTNIPQIDDDGSESSVSVSRQTTVRKNI